MVSADSFGSALGDSLVSAYGPRPGSMQHQSSVSANGSLGLSGGFNPFAWLNGFSGDDTEIGIHGVSSTGTDDAVDEDDSFDLDDPLGPDENSVDVGEGGGQPYVDGDPTPYTNEYGDAVDSNGLGLTLSGASPDEMADEDIADNGSTDSAVAPEAGPNLYQNLVDGMGNASGVGSAINNGQIVPFTTDADGGFSGASSDAPAQENVVPSAPTGPDTSAVMTASDISSSQATGYVQSKAGIPVSTAHSPTLTIGNDSDFFNLNLILAQNMTSDEIVGLRNSGIPIPGKSHTETNAISDFLHFTKTASYVPYKLEIRNPPSPSQIASNMNSLQGYVQQASAKYGISVKLINAVIYVESKGRINSVSGTGGLGPLQLTQYIYGPSRDLGPGINPFDPAQAVDRATKFLSHLSTQFHGNTAEIVAAYNQTPTIVNDALRNYGADWIAHLPLQAQNYIRSINAAISNGY